MNGPLKFQLWMPRTFLKLQPYEVEKWICTVTTWGKPTSTYHNLQIQSSIRMKFAPSAFP